jgi:uncharacterized YccA/Bax inhibitor family protein
MRSGNPILREDTFAAPSRGAVMTVQGSVSRALVLLVLAVAGASTIWGRAISDPTSGVVGLGLAGGAIGGLVLALVTIFKKEWAPVTAPLYAFVEGIFLGAISASFEVRYPGIAIQAVGLTFGTCFAMLALYKAGVLKATPGFRRGVFAATGAIMLVYLASFAMSFFGMQMPYLHDSGPIGIGISLVIVGVAAFNLVLDFDLIESGAAQGAPKYMEWYGAFALMVTLVWLYLEMLRLLAKLQRR